MKRINLSSRLWWLILALGASALLAASAGQPQTPFAVGPNGVVVRPAFGGMILGFDIDSTGTLGMLSEFKFNRDGTILAATETFDQATGAIVQIVQQTGTQDDFLTLGVVGAGVGLFEQEHPRSTFHVERTYSVVQPLAAGVPTGAWTPPFGRNQNVDQVKTDVGTAEVAVLAIDLTGHGHTTIFTSDVGANTFGPRIEIADEDFNFQLTPVMVFDSRNNRAILGHNARSPFIMPPKIGFLDLTTGAFTKMNGNGLGLINGMALDAEDQILCTTVSFVPTVQFYDLEADNHGISVRLPQAGDSLFRGQTVVFDPVNRLFLVAQEFTSTGGSGSSIQVYDTAGNFVESIDGLDFINPARLTAIRIALNPATRTGFVDGPPGGTTI